MDPTIRTLAPSFRQHLLATNRSGRPSTHRCRVDKEEEPALLMAS
jgi:hypothetical protein